MNFVCASAREAEAVLAQAKQRVVRPMYSSPPLHGARVAAEILGDPELRALWYEELQGMSARLAAMRAQLAAALAEAVPERSWQHIVDQIGMFAFTGLSPAQVDALLADSHVYLTRDGRLSVAGLTAADIPYVAAAIRSAVAKTE